VAQTGDIEAHGAYDNPLYNGYRFVEQRLKTLLDLDDAYMRWTDVYGNHDIWPASWPLPDTSHVGSNAMNALRLTHDLEERRPFEDSWPGLVTPVPSDVGPAISVFRLNSVLDDQIRGGIFAQGELGSHPRGNQQALADLASNSRLPAHENSLRILLTHHPIARFQNQSTGSNVGGDEEFGKSNAAIHLVLAGHKHEIDPVKAQDVSTDPQAPLPLGIGQLVASTPTQCGKHHRSLCVYRVYLDEGGNFFNITRIIYENRTAADFKTSTEKSALAGISVNQ
jgi:hypothetical protein